MSAVTMETHRPRKFTREQRQQISKTITAWHAERRAQRVASPLGQNILALRAKGKTFKQIANELKTKQHIVRSYVAQAKQQAPTVKRFPLEAIPARAPTAHKPAAPASARMMRVVVKAGSVIKVTIGGVEVEIVAEAR